MNTRLRDRHRRPLRAGPGLVYLQRRPHEHVQPQHQHPEDAGEVPGALGGPQRVRRRGSRHPARHRRRPTFRRSCCRSAPRASSQSTEDRRSAPTSCTISSCIHFLRYGAAGEDPVPRPAGPVRPGVLASRASHWLRVFVQRFFANQFKRSCLPDGPKVGSVSLSPRGDWRMPSDAQVRCWLEELEDT